MAEAPGRQGRGERPLRLLKVPDVRRVPLPLVAAWRGVLEFFDSDGLTHAASIAYYALLSLFPFLLLLLSLLGSLTADEADRDAVVTFVFRYFPRQFDFITRQFDAFRAQTVSLGIGGLLALTWASLGVFNAVSSAVNHSWGVERKRGFLRHRLLSFVMLVSAAGLFAAALLLASAAKIVRTEWFSAVAALPGVGWLESLAVTYAATVLLIGCVALVFYFVPNTAVRFRYVWPGAIVTGLLWQGAFNLFSWYARDLARWNVIHGSIAAVVVFLVWVYVSAAILLYGVELTASYVKLKEMAAAHEAGG